ncbi:hypothetical protein [Sandaracinobacteroides saxicola]|uniref:Uncharacterized protein n=1 Tax=Sandaracinobacteroides saxicola TaxID=2759707 RepID=A0A7G5IF75_9SPHN|nr:hypothetical protein [Sandaracinobacteroides saxicola]QMW22017.1 hypothetical protein H3309_11620 [Sandaracinobacteroides saxicola]
MRGWWLATLLLGGCAMAPQLGRVAVDHNELVANTTNQLLLVNVLRARERLPMHFTSISALRGQANVKGDLGLGGGVAGKGSTANLDAAGLGTGGSISQAAATLSPSMGIEVTSGSSFDVAVHNTQEFYAGITTSIPQATVAGYLYAGWPADLVTFMFVTDVEIRVSARHVPAGPDDLAPGAVLARVVNAPDMAGWTQGFAALARCFQVQPDSGDGDAKAPPLRWMPAGDAPCRVAVTEGARLRGGAVVREVVLSRDARGLQAELVAAGAASQKVEVRFVSTIRSVEGLVYYMGALARRGDAPRVLRTTLPSGESIDMPILVVRPGAAPDAFVSARFGGRLWSVPASGAVQNSVAGSSSAVFVLVQQLMNLQRSAREQVMTPTVRIAQ